MVLSWIGFTAALIKALLLWLGLPLLMVQLIADPHAEERQPGLQRCLGLVRKPGFWIIWPAPWWWSAVGTGMPTSWGKAVV